MTKVSVITASYNSESTIEDALRSVAEQSHSEVEHIIIDGGSQDRTLVIVDEYSHISLLISEEDAGIYDAMNKGVANSSGDIIGILNSDDYYPDENVVSDVVRIFEDSTIDLVYGDLTYIDEKGKTVRNWKAGRFDKSKFKRGWMPPHPTVFVRREIYSQYGDFRLDMGTSADYELLLRWLYRYDVRPFYLERPLVVMRTGGVSNASIRNRLRANKMDKKAWRVNDLNTSWYTRFMKPLRKLTQWLVSGHK